MTTERSTVTVAFINGRVVRYKVDMVGNNLDAVLWWCDTHAEPVWVFGDGSFECPHTLIVGRDSRDHVFVTPPWSGDV